MTQSMISYPLFVRVISPSGRVVQTSELTVDMPAHNGSKSDLSMSARVDIPLMIGECELVIATKNQATGASFSVRSLAARDDPAQAYSLPAG
jgi:hypothetical protein